MTATSTHSNHLIHSTSPYLLQHAHNPVDWYPWGTEAFQKAAREDKPIFLSIGYSTCHWCHVMAHESFEDSTVAAYLNKYFVCIKVDREERPDIDQLYMAAAMRLAGRGGWPLTIVMGADKKPFFAGTYFPKESSSGRVGLLELLPRLQAAWVNQREDIEQAAEQIVAALRQPESPVNAQPLGEETLRQADASFGSSFDKQEGGFGTAPKFPAPHNLVFLLREGQRTGNVALTKMALQTLTQLRLGGIYDQIGFGFHRYSTDARWHVPHFEKMLYDQADLLLAYTEAWAVTGDSLYRQTMDELLIYLQQKLLAPEGAYYAAEDADSDGEEGKYYVWTWDELQQILGAERLKELAPIFELKPAGNFRDEASGHGAGSNIFHLRSVADLEKLDFNDDWSTERRQLYQVREKRVHPDLDNKLLADWNGLALAALARAATATGDTRFALAAGQLVSFLQEQLITPETELLHLPDQGAEIIGGFLDDYSFIIQGLRYYYEVTFDAQVLELAVKLQQQQLKYFWDEKSGGFFLTAAGNQGLLVRQKEIYDGAMPSGNSVAASNLYYLGRITEKPEWEAMATTIGTVFSDQVARVPRGFTALLASVQVQVAGSREVVIAGTQEQLQAALGVLRQVYDPFKLILFRPNDQPEKIEDLAGFLKYQRNIDGQLTVYICENYTCQQPVTGIERLQAALEQEQEK